MSKMLEIRWHGRGGQGAKSAALLLAEAAMDAGKYIQGFPEYGPERAGAPIKAYTRISDEQIDIHCGVTNPQIVIVIDPTLLASVPVTEGLKSDGILLVNSDKDPKTVREMLDMKDGKVYTVDANKIAMDTIKKPLPNTPMIGALIGATNLIEEKNMEKQIHHKFFSKLGQKGVDANIEAVKRAIKEVKGE
ncbi:MAG: 2-oxoacid:acceptor oxidoreductase family protein [Vulcanimicrobiota bacterium]